MSFNSVLAAYFHMETRIPNYTSSGNPLKNMGCTDPQLPLQRPVTRSFDVFFDLYLNKRLSINQDASDLRPIALIMTSL